MSDHEQDLESEEHEQDVVREFKTPMSGLPATGPRHALPGPPDMREYRPADHDGAFDELERMRREFNGEGQRSPQDLQDAAYAYLVAVGLTPTPDAVGQLTHVFLRCLTIMCERGYDPNGANWREGGWRSQLVDIRKKFKRLWYHGWLKGIFIPDHPIDMINYLGYYVRLAGSGDAWGDWGEPGEPPTFD